MGTLLLPDVMGRTRQFAGDLDIRGWIQTDDYSCGYAAAKTILGFYGIRVKNRELWDELQPRPDDGVTTGNLLAACRRRGLRMSKFKLNLSNLKEAFRKQRPVLVCSRLDSQPPGEEHWMVAAGTWGNQVLLLNQPSVLNPRDWWEAARLLRRASDPVCWVASRR